MPLTSTQLRIGRLFEAEFERQAHNRGHFVVRHCDQLGVTGTKAPMVTGPYQGYRLPDFSIIAHKQMHWAEAKYKSVPSWCIKTRQWEHGIDLPNWLDYLTVCEMSGQPGYMIVGEGDSGLVLIASFKRLSAYAREYDGHQHFIDGAVFWPRDVFKPWGEFRPQAGQMRFNFGETAE